VQLELDGSLQRILLQNTQGEQVPKIAAVITWRSFLLSRSTRQSRDSLLRSRAESGINLMKLFYNFSSCQLPLRTAFWQVIRFHSP
jgi:hypothetical protein